jgi:hypothetical protein
LAGLNITLDAQKLHEIVRNMQLMHGAYTAGIDTLQSTYATNQKLID